MSGKKEPLTKELAEEKSLPLRKVRVLFSAPLNEERKDVFQELFFWEFSKIRSDVELVSYIIPPVPYQKEGRLEEMVHYDCHDILCNVNECASPRASLKEVLSEHIVPEEYLVKEAQLEADLSFSFHTITKPWVSDVDRRVIERDLYRSFPISMYRNRGSADTMLLECAKDFALELSLHLDRRGVKQ